ncbi:MAG: class I SAM-dependent methyltransferase [Clostridia bacterium]|nr:class I SAM-dependent methyltransferase [Clostridia bacterium]
MSQQVKEFYDKYGIKEWNRLDDSFYNRINYLLYLDFIRDHVKKDMKVLDAGCGAGRFSLELAKQGCKVTLFDLSDVQLKIAKEKIDEFNLSHQVEGYHQGTIMDLSCFPDDTFDFLICYGAPLSYILKDREVVLSEFRRVLKPEGTLALSVNNKWGILKRLLGQGNTNFFSQPEYWYLKEVLLTGDLREHEAVSHPPRHFFESNELEHLLKETFFIDIVLAGNPCFSSGNHLTLETLSENTRALETIIDLELKSYQMVTMIEQGEFLLAKAKKQQT